MIAQPQISFVVSAPADPIAIDCDGRLVSQALTNVLKNAVEAVDTRFGVPSAGSRGAGKIVVSLQLAAHEIDVRVTDNGVGLPQAERERLTEPYVTTRAKGTGLGLAIVKKILEDHGGSVTLEDLPSSPGGNGAQVTLHFPATLAIEAAAPLRVAGE